MLHNINNLMNNHISQKPIFFYQEKKNDFLNKSYILKMRFIEHYFQS